MQAFFVVEDEIGESLVIVSVLIGGKELLEGLLLCLFSLRATNAKKCVACRKISAIDVYDTSYQLFGPETS